MNSRKQASNLLDGCKLLGVATLLWGGMLTGIFGALKFGASIAPPNGEKMAAHIACSFIPSKHPICGQQAAEGKVVADSAKGGLVLAFSGFGVFAVTRKLSLRSDEGHRAQNRIKSATP